MKYLSDNKLADGLLKHHSETLEFIYCNYFPVIESFVIHHQGTREEAKDVFQEGMLIIYRKLKNEQLKLTCKFSTYLYAVCKKIWIQERKKRLVQQKRLREYPMNTVESGVMDPGYDMRDLKQIMEKHLEQLSPDCQKILKLFFNDCSMDEIREEMGYKTMHHAIDRKYRCKRSLISRILKDPLYKRLKDEIR